MMAWAKLAVNYGFRKERLDLLPFQEMEFLGRNTRQQNFWIRSRSHLLGRTCFEGTSTSTPFALAFGIERQLGCVHG
jgi:hypothetical protein